MWKKVAKIRYKQWKKIVKTIVEIVEKSCIFASKPKEYAQKKDT